MSAVSPLTPVGTPSLDEADALAALGALAQAMRLRVFRALVAAGPEGLTPGALSDALDVPASTLSFHLAELARTALVTQERDGRRLIYRPSLDRMDALLGYLTDHCCGGRPCGVAPRAGRGGPDAPRGHAAARRPATAAPAPLSEDSAMKHEKRYNVLFVCTGNTARSILAEALTRHLGGDRFQAFSAGSRPGGTIHPLTIRTLNEMRLPVEGYRSKDWREFAQAGAPVMDFVFTVCDTAAGEACPTWPGQPLTAHWGVADPVALEGSEARRAKAFIDTAMILRRRIELLLNLPLHALDAIAIGREIREIGHR